MLKNTLWLMGFWLAFALIIYAGITASLCRGISAYSEADQKAMQLTPADCAKPFYKRV